MAPPPPPAAIRPTTVLDLHDDLLRKVFLRLPSLASLVRAALACRTFLRAVRSCPAFRRNFRALHPSPFVGLFVGRFPRPKVRSFDAHGPCSDRDLAAAVRGGDFSLAGVPVPLRDGDGDGHNKDEDEESNKEEEDEGTHEKNENKEEEEDTDQDEEKTGKEDDDDYNEKENWVIQRCCGGDSKDEDEESKEEEDGTHQEDENKEEEEDTDQDEEKTGKEEDDDDYNENVNWVIQRCCDGYVVLFNRWAQKIAAYNPLTRALHLFRSPPGVWSSPNYEFHIASSEEDPGMPIRVVYSDFDCLGRWAPVVGVFSSDSWIGVWDIFPETVSRFTYRPNGRWDFTQAAKQRHYQYLTSKMVNGSLYVTHTRAPYIIAFNTATLQFTKMDWPPLFAVGNDRQCGSVIGNTKDGRPCIVCSHSSRDFSLEVYFRRRDDNGVEGWILDQTFPLETIHQFIKFSEGDDDDVDDDDDDDDDDYDDGDIAVRLIEVIDGTVYLRTDHDTEAPQLLSFCLETAELKMICEDYHKPVYPYIMAWPPSLLPHDKGEALSTPSFEGSYVKVGGETTQPASVAKA